jgi:UDP-N-acetylmuramyl pentapeptide phosphotransferase/UDP-N-acetylglucosamine-1-phosphate transferase
VTSGWVLAAAIVPALVCALVIAMLRGSRLHAALADQPNERSLHVQPRPRVGGIGVMVAALASGLLLADGQVKLVLLLAAALSVVSFADDRASLPIAARLLAHIAAAAAIAFTCIGAASWPLAIVATLAIAWMTNLFNFMDGADGLAGGMGTIGFGAYAAAAAFAHDLPFALGCLVLASACAGFLLHNFPPARVFMGDTGSIPLGFLAGALGTLGAVRGLWAWWFPVLAFAPFILDASVTLARRAVKRERIWRAHRSHSYQRLVLSGWSHRKLAMHAYALMLVSAACALAAQRAESPMRWAIIWGWAAVLLALFGSLERRFARTASSPLPGLDP